LNYNHNFTNNSQFIQIIQFISMYSLKYWIDIDHLIWCWYGVDGRYLPPCCFMILFISTDVFDIDNRDKSSKCASLGRFLYLFLMNVDLLKVASHKYVDPKNVEIALTFGKREHDDSSCYQKSRQFPFPNCLEIFCVHLRFYVLPS